MRIPKEDVEPNTIIRVHHHFSYFKLISDKIPRDNDIQAKTEADKLEAEKVKCLKEKFLNERKEFATNLYEKAVNIAIIQ